MTTMTAAEAEQEASAIALSIIGTDSGLQAPKSVEAGVAEITFENTGKNEHEAQLIRIEGDHTPQDVIDSITSESGKIPDWLSGGGGVGTTEPGQTRTVTQVLEPGSYAIVNTDAKKPQSAALEVTGEAAGGDLPETDATVTASEYTFETSGLKAGSNRFLFENTGKELHHIIAGPVKPDATREQVSKYYQSDGKSKNPFRGDEEAGVSTAVIDGGESQVVELDLPAGKYAFQCFIPDRKGGPPHAFKGMITIEEVAG